MSFKICAALLIVSGLGLMLTSVKADQREEFLTQEWCLCMGREKNTTYCKNDTIVTHQAGMTDVPAFVEEAAKNGTYCKPLISAPTLSPATGNTTSEPSQAPPAAVSSFGVVFIVVGVVLALALAIAVVAWFVYQRNKKNESQINPQGGGAMHSRTTDGTKV